MILFLNNYDVTWLLLREVFFIREYFIAFLEEEAEGINSFIHCDFLLVEDIDEVIYLVLIEDALSIFRIFFFLVGLESNGHNFIFHLIPNILDLLDIDPLNFFFLLDAGIELLDFGNDAPLGLLLHEILNPFKGGLDFLVKLDRETNTLGSSFFTLSMNLMNFWVKT